MGVDGRIRGGLRCTTQNRLLASAGMAVNLLMLRFSSASAAPQGGPVTSEIILFPTRRPRMVTLVNGRPIHVARKISPEIKFGDAPCEIRTRGLCSPSRGPVINTPFICDRRKVADEIDHTVVQATARLIFSF